MTRRELSTVTARYTQWDGTQRLKLDADKVFEKLAEYLSYTDDVRQAMDWMMRQGMDFDGVRVMGLEEFIEQLRQEMRQRYREFNLKNALSEMEQKLEDILNRERAKLESLKGQKPGVEEKQRELSRMPRRLLEAMRKLESYEFEDPQAKADFDELLDEYENIRDLENFRDRNQHMFHGPKSLGYDDALELMREMERMRELEQDLMSGNFDTISMEDLQRILGQQAGKDFQNLRQVMVLLTQSGYMVPKGDHFQLSPRGVRRIGQLALRDIYQNLLKDRSGGHLTDHRGVTEMRPEQTKPYGFAPFDPRRQRHQGAHVGLCSSADLNRVGVETPNNRSVHGVGRAESSIEKRPARAKPRPALAPDRIDTRHVAGRVSVERALQYRPPDIHRQLPPQRTKSGVHLRGDRACMSACRRIFGPEKSIRKILGQIFKDRQRLPDTYIAVDQRRHSAGTAEGRHPRFKVRSIERYQRLLECNTGDLHRQPRPERPGRVILIADDQAKSHGRSARSLARDQISMAPVREQERSDETGHHSQRRRENDRRGGKRYGECRFNPPVGRRLNLVCILNRFPSERNRHFKQ